MADSSCELPCGTLVSEGPPISSNNDVDLENSGQKARKVKPPGIIYLSSIPEGMQYNDVYKYFSDFGDIGRISLQESARQPHNKKLKRFEEGWIEFLDKRTAKRCALLLNSSTVGGKRKNKWYDCIWSIKYLPKFQWSHLTDRLAYEQAIHQQRMRTEIAQARKEASHFAEQLDRKLLDQQMSSKKADWKSNKRRYDFTQRSTDEEIKKRKAGSERVKRLESSRSNVLGSLFASDDGKTK